MPHGGMYVIMLIVIGLVIVAYLALALVIARMCAMNEKWDESADAVPFPGFSEETEEDHEPRSPHAA